MNRLCVYCGSSPGKGNVYTQAAVELGRFLAAEQIGLVYGGASKGLMGVLADTVLDAGGHASGVIPRALFDKEIAHTGLSERHIVESMHERKSMMVALSDGFIALPGGPGTLEEIAEVLTWAQLQFHSKPCGLLNVNGYFDHLIAHFDHAVAEGFLRPEHRQMMIVSETPAELIESFRHYDAPVFPKWTD